MRTNKNFGQWPRIEVAADSMRVGKTTAVKVIAEGLQKKGVPVKSSYEDWQHNPYLTKSYQDPTKAFLKSQKWFVKRKFEQVNQGSPGMIFIQDLPPEGDYNYALTNFRIGRMSKADFQEYQEYYFALAWEKVPAPDLLIYLMADDDVLLQRAKAAAREFEVVDGEYFLALKKVNRAWLKQAKRHWEVLVVETNEHDYANNTKHQEELMELIIKKLKLNGFIKII